MMARFRWIGWFDGAEDCEPPEPGKFWIEIQDGFEEYAIIVHRTSKEFDQLDDTVLQKERDARHIVDCLNYMEGRTINV